MLSQDPIPTQPFWVDGPYPYYPDQAAPDNSAGVRVGRTRIFSYLLEFIVVTAIAIALQFSLLAWLFLIALMGWFPLMSIYILRRRQAAQARATEIQQQARERIGASIIGSAIHVAGHPLLTREQNVVIALCDSQLSLFSYQNAKPIDTFPVADLQAVQTIVYDDERVPHTDVVDSTAQALQLTFRWHGNTCTCLFRQMRKVRPIDWYHAIQQVRAIGSASSG